ncbi:MAG TPA: TIGR00341 family protein [Methanoregulaceae archaeon]|nr:TIGR00341 family protein [Methanoregulaceae archaeon]
MAQGFFARLKTDRFNTEYIPAFEDKLFFEGEKRPRKIANFSVLLGLATVIATYGIITDSTATVIGAMIVAPLMTPIMATGAAISMGSSKRAISSIALVILGVLGVILFAVVLTAIAQGHLISLTENSQITSRVRPGLLDLFIALAAGAAGAFAIGRQEIADSLAGVAIAISLVPPLCVVGISLYFGDIIYAGGAFLLFLTNFMAILVAGMATFGLMGLPRAVTKEMKDKTRKNVMVAIMIASVVLVAVLTVMSYQAYHETRTQIETAGAVQEWLGPAQYQIQSVVVSGSDVTVTLIGAGPVPPLGPLYLHMSDLLGRPVTIQVHAIPENNITYPA